MSNIDSSSAVVISYCLCGFVFFMNLYTDFHSAWKHYSSDGKVSRQPGAKEYLFWKQHGHWPQAAVVICIRPEQYEIPGNANTNSSMDVRWVSEVLPLAEELLAADGS